jgi:two-component system sensor histidine kinase HupT/HoxJ
MSPSNAKDSSRRRARLREATARARAMDASSVQASHALAGLDESTWIDLIRKMEDMYRELLEHEVALEENNAALEDSQRFIYGVLASMSDVLIVCDRLGRIEVVNVALTRMVGRTEEDLRGSDATELLADEASRQRLKDILAFFPRETVSDLEVQLRASTGASMPVTVNCTPRFNAVGKMVGLVLSGRPVGELRRAYEALRNAHEELKRTQQQLVQAEKMASLGLLVAGVAHELNNPISFVLGNAHALRRYVDRLRSYLDAVHEGRSKPELAALRSELKIDRILADLDPLIDGTVEGAERTRDIVEDLKRFSAPGRGETTRFDLAEVVDRGVRWVSRAAPAPVAVDVALPAWLPVEGNPGQIQQVVVNLVQNALDSIGRAPGGRLRISGGVADGRVSIAFHDSGPGIPEEHLPRVFDPFFTTKPVGKGTGLGLSISYGIVERHGGQLAAANHENGGAVLTLTLPLCGK